MNLLGPLLRMGYFLQYSFFPSFPCHLSFLRWVVLFASFSWFRVIFNLLSFFIFLILFIQVLIWFQVQCSFAVFVWYIFYCRRIHTRYCPSCRFLCLVSYSNLMSFSFQFCIFLIFFFTMWFFYCGFQSGVFIQFFLFLSECRFCIIVGLPGIFYCSAVLLF